MAHPRGPANIRWRVSDGPEKRCKRCRQVKPAADFYRNARKRELLQCYCIACTRALSRESSVRRQARARGATVVEKFTRADVYERDGGRCHLCGEPVDPARWDIDHLVPIARGGQHTFDNVAVAHPSCNGKRDMTPMERRQDGRTWREDTGQLSLWPGEEAP